MPPAKDPKRGMLKALLALGSLAILGVLVWYVHSLTLKKSASEKRQVAIVLKIIRPPEPPPEPPPPPPPPEKVEEPIPQDTPQDKPVEQAPESAQLGIDAEGGAGDSFGLVGHAGGRDLIGSGNGPFVFYAGMVKDVLLDALSNVDRIKRSKYSVDVRVWIGGDGRIERASLVQSTGNRDIDSAIEKALTQIAKVREPPPIEMPQPITLKIVSRG
jgi:protein TonB